MVSDLATREVKKEDETKSTTWSAIANNCMLKLGTHYELEHLGLFNITIFETVCVAPLTLFVMIISKNTTVFF